MSSGNKGTVDAAATARQDVGGVLGAADLYDRAGLDDSYRDADDNDSDFDSDLDTCAAVAETDVEGDDDGDGSDSDSDSDSDEEGGSGGRVIVVEDVGEGQCDDDDDDDDDDDAGRVLGELVAMFVEKNGRDPNEDEMKEWTKALKGLTLTGAVGRGEESFGEDDDDSILADDHPAVATE